jgi:hypothetical protein
MIRLAHVVAAALSLPVVAGCAAPPSGQGLPPASADGFNDGCQSGRAAQDVLGRARKDVRRLKSDPQYAQGWSDGYRQCEYEQMQKNASGGP